MSHRRYSHNHRTRNGETMATVIGDLIAADVTAHADQTTATTAAQTADAALATANGAVTSADQALGAALASIGSVFTIDTNGVVTVYEPNGSGGFNTVVPKPATTPLPTAPAPTS